MRRQNVKMVRRDLDRSRKGCAREFFAVAGPKLAPLQGSWQSLKLWLLIVSLTGCSATALHDRTIDIGGSVGSIYTSQVLENLRRLSFDRNAVPSHFNFDNGTVKTSETVTPTLSIPLGNQVTRTVAAAGVTQIVGSYNGLTLSGTETVDQSWGIKPQDDPDALRWLRALYLYVLGWAQYRPVLDRAPGDPALTNILKTCEPTPQSPSCFQIRGETPCAAPSAFSQAKENWICLGQYRGILDRTGFEPEMIITKKAYCKDVLFDLVLYSRRVLRTPANSTPARKSQQKSNVTQRSKPETDQ